MRNDFKCDLCGSAWYVVKRTCITVNQPFIKQVQEVACDNCGHPYTVTITNKLHNFIIESVNLLKDETGG